MNYCYRAPGEKTIRVLVADNSCIHTRLLANALQLDSLLGVIPFESDSSSLVRMATAQNIDVLVISSNLDEQNSRGIEVLLELHKQQSHIRSVLLPDSSKDEIVVQAFRAGARGVFGRNEPMELLSKCVRCVYQGQIWANSHHLAIAMMALASAPAVRAVNAEGMNLLSEREIEVVHCLAEGLTNREIAQRLHLSPHTVKNYFFRIFDKLGVSSRVELLFMSLSQASAEHGAAQVQKNDYNGDYSSLESDLLRKSADAGLPAAQLALAQMQLVQRKDPQDLVEAYMWYLIATESAIQARGFVAKMLTPEQIEQAKDRATAWLAKKKKAPQPVELSLLPEQTPSEKTELHRQYGD